MKKICKIMGCALIALSLTGCNSNPTPTSENENVVSLSKGDFNISVNDLYAELKKDYATNYIINEIDKEILSKEYETDEKAKNYAENQVKITKLYYENDDSKLLAALRNAGYESIDAYKELLIMNYKRQLATDDYVRKTVTDKEIQKYYDENIYGDVTISHILVTMEASENLTSEEKAEAEKTANEKVTEILKKLEEGKSFEEVAKEYSEDTATASKGGKLGTFNKGEMTSKFNSEFENEVLKLKEKEYTKKAIKSSYGYHIIYKESQKDKPALESVKQTIIDNLLDDKKNDDDKVQYKAMIELRENYGLTFNDDEIKNQYENAKNNWLYGE